MSGARHDVKSSNVVSNNGTAVLKESGSGGGRAGNENSAPSPRLIETLNSARTRGPRLAKRPGLEVEDGLGAPEAVADGAGAPAPHSSFAVVNRRSRRGSSMLTATPISSWSWNLKPMGMLGRYERLRRISISLMLAEKGSGVSLVSGNPITPLLEKSVSSSLMVEGLGIWVV